MMSSKLLSDVAQAFVEPEAFGTQMHRALRAIVASLHLSRAYVFIDGKGSTSMMHSHEWCAEGIARQDECLQDIPYVSYAAWKRMLTEEGRILSNDIATLPDELRAVLEPQWIQSVLVYPLEINEQIAGFIGFDDCSHRRWWSEEELYLLKTASRIISSFCQREARQADLASRTGPQNRPEEQEARLRNIIDGRRLGTWEWHVLSGEAFFNERCAGIVGYTLAELAPVSIDTWKKLAHPEDLARSEALLQKHLAGESDYYDMECRMRHKDDDRWIWVHDVGQVIEWSPDGKPLQMFGTRSDITEKKSLEERIRQISIHDPLTEIYNRRYVFDRLEAFDAEYARLGRNFCISILDIDHFKVVNDSYGHLAGDFILKEFASLVNLAIRPYDMLGRYGGEEFIIVSVNSSATETAFLIDRIRNLIKNRAFVYNDAEIQFTFSCGIADSAEFSLEKFPIEKMVEMADRRLHEAKEAGRDRLVAPQASQDTEEQDE